MTGKEMCEVIERSKILIDKDGRHPTAEEIWNYSPTGELSAVFDWYDQARVSLGLITPEELIAEFEARGYPPEMLAPMRESLAAITRAKGG